MRATKYLHLFKNEDSKPTDDNKVWSDIEIIDKMVVITVWDFGENRKSLVMNHFKRGRKKKYSIPELDYKPIGKEIHKHIFVFEHEDFKNQIIQLHVYEDWNCVEQLSWSFSESLGVFRKKRL